MYAKNESSAVMEEKAIDDNFSVTILTITAIPLVT